jgi:hypothetical protein
MEANYYISVRPRINETHSVHKEGCPFMADDDKRIFLGTFRSGREALNAGRLHFLNSATCPFCSKEIKAETKEDVYNLRPANDIRIPVIIFSSMFCGVN